MHRRLFIELSPDEQRVYIEGMRARRLRALATYKELQAKRHEAKATRAGEKAQKQSAMLEKELAALEKALDKVEVRLSTIQALTLIAENEYANGP